jgi:hypothetical protein
LHASKLAEFANGIAPWQGFEFFQKIDFVALATARETLPEILAVALKDGKRIALVSMKGTAGRFLGVRLQSQPGEQLGQGQAKFCGVNVVAHLAASCARR